MRTILSVAVLLGLAGAGAYYYLKFYHNEGTSSFRMAQVERGNMLPTIEATGSLEPEQVVDIGSQVNGLITELKVDYGSEVEKGTVLATIDETLYKAAVDQNSATVNSAKANLLLAKANLVLAQANLRRDDQLIKKGAIAPNQYDTDFAACEVAKATVAVDEAAIKQAEATLEQSTTNLGYCNITSPVKGTIVDRRVNVGQTVVSNLSASSLFLLAKDLSKIQVWASVNEADIGRIHKGVKVRFKVDAYPNETFVGEVAQIRLNATMTQNVVTYTVVVTTDNKDMKLLPYMTASLLFEIERHENVLKVPNAALRWKPRPKQIAPDIRAETVAAMNRPKQADDNKDGGKRAAEGKNAVQSGQPGQPPASKASITSGEKGTEPLATSGGTATGLKPADWKARTEKNAGKDAKTVVAAAPQEAKSAQGRQPPGRPITPQEAKEHKEHYESGRLWIAEGNFVRPVPVKIIATDGTMTEVRGKDVSEGLEVVIGENIATDADNDTSNPFMPKLFRGNASNSKSSGSSK
ncbi:MAG: efflux RND transporter periplasmic adaptor subunit [Thermoguttaceae bacterium]